MVVKFFSNKKGGSVKALDYLLNHREKDGTARVLIGDEQLTRNIINSISFKHKVCVGCLSFEEENIDENLKYKIMEDFEYIVLIPYFLFFKIWTLIKPHFYKLHKTYFCPYFFNVYRLFIDLFVYKFHCLLTNYFSFLIFFQVH